MFFQPISQILKKYGAESINEHYKEFDHLTSFLRKQLVHTVVKFFLENKFALKKADLELISQMIITEFPNEDSNFYYKNPAETGCNPTGALFYRYNNQLVPMRKHKILPYNGLKRITSKISVNDKGKYLGSFYGELKFLDR